MLNVAMISKWHVHAEGYAKEINASGDARVTCVWDEDAARGSEWARALGVPFIGDYDMLLARSDVDAVAICSPTNAHKRLMLGAAGARKHIFTEKVMCLTTNDALEVSDAISRAGVIFTISFPHMCMPESLYIKRAIAAGKLGRVTLFRVRNCHGGALANWLPDYWYDPETTGGGAMMDLGAHPMYLSRWFLGEPESIQSAFSDFTSRGVEDDAVSVITFKSGAVAIAETSLVSPYAPRLMEVYGTQGAIICENGKLREKTDGGDWTRPELPGALPSPIRQFIDSAVKGAPVRFGAAEGVELTELMERAYMAHAQKRRVAFN